MRTEGLASNKKHGPILVIGNGDTACSLALCLITGKQRVTLFTNRLQENERRIQFYLQHHPELTENQQSELNASMDLTDRWPDSENFQIAFILTDEAFAETNDHIQKLERNQSEDLVIGISSDHIPLSTFQKNSSRPENILICNWTQPAHTTSFLELVTNPITNNQIGDDIQHLAKTHWGKDPYHIQGEFGIRGRLIAALIREAFFLVENGYASVEDIDRACRNDAGTNAPFAGNFLYMDLMGTYAYGIVMQDLNKELATGEGVPSFFTELVDGGETGLKAGRGFYKYSEEEIEELDQSSLNFSFRIRELMSRYSSFQAGLKERT